MADFSRYATATVWPGLLALIFWTPLLAIAQTTDAEPRFDLDTVDAQAIELARRAYADPGPNLSGSLLHLSQDLYHRITFRPDAAYWQSARLPFVLQFFHEGWRFDHAVKIAEVAGNEVHEIAFDPQWFDYDASGVEPSSVSGVGYAGLRVTAAVNAPARKDEVLSFLGASYFRALGRNQVYGMSARGLAVDTAVASGEEFPRFVEFWAERPQPHDRQLVLYALLDSRRVTGAYRFVLQPGADTTIEVSARLHLRDGIEKLGMAPLTSMFFHGANQRAAGEDYRPEVHDSDGLSVATRAGEWLWRPLANPKRLLVTSFHDTNPRGFGLLQRARDFTRYEDLDAHYERHPSVWVEPLEDWGAGRVELVEIPSPDETNDNIVAFWVADGGTSVGKTYELKYRLHWAKDAVARPDTAWVAQTRRGKGFLTEPDDSIGFVVDYAGPMFAGLAADADVVASVSSDANAEVVAHSTARLPNGNWRLLLRVKRHDNGKPVELRATLRSIDKESETWSYILPPE